MSQETLIVLLFLLDIFYVIFFLIFDRRITYQYKFMLRECDQLRKEISKLDEAAFEINNRNSAGSSDERKTMSSDKNSENSDEGAHKCMQ